MSRSTVWSAGPLVRRVALLAAAGVGAAALLAGCSAGQITQTAAKGPSIEGVDANVGPIQIRNAIVERPPTGDVWPAGSDVPVRVRIVNEGRTPDTLVAAASPVASAVDLVDLDATPSPSASASASGSPAGSPASPSAPAPSASVPGSPAASGSPTPEGSGSPSASPAASSEPLPLPPGVLVILDTGSAQLVLKDVTTALGAGTLVPVALRFALAGDVVLRLPIEPPAEPKPRTSLTHAEDATKEGHG